jgi:hypothetical protein
MKKSQKGFIVPLLVVAIVVILIIGGGIYYLSQNGSTNQAGSSTNIPPISQMIIEGQAYKPDHNYKTNPDGSSIPTQLVFISPQNKRISVPKDVAIKIDSAIRFLVNGQRGGEDISGTIANPLSPNSLVVVTDDIKCVSDICTSIHHFYNYDLISSILKTLYTSSPQQTSNDGVNLEPVATQSSKIITRVHTPGTNSICGGIWEKGANYYSLDLLNISDGLKAFEAPDNLIKRDKDREIECQAKL